MRNTSLFKVLAVTVCAALGWAVAGCKSAPELSQTQAQSLIQAYYDQQPAQGADIFVNDLGMREGVTAKYWDRTKSYPNPLWADFKLSDAGKKVVKLPEGGDVINWRPQSADDTHYAVRMTTVAANHLKARDVSDIEDEMVPGADTAKGATFNESVDLTGVPGPLVDIAHNPGNRLSTKRHADFVLTNGAWTLKAVQ